MPAAAKGSNLTGSVFFFKRAIFRLKKNCLLIMCLYVLSP